MGGSKIGSGWAAAVTGPRISSASSTPASVMRAILHGRRTTRPARPVSDLSGVDERSEHDAPLLGDPLLVHAAAPADDTRRGAPDECGRAPLELEQPRLETGAEGIVTPRAVTADHPMTREQQGHRIG